MTDRISRRDLIKGIGVVGVGGLFPATNPGEANRSSGIGDSHSDISVKDGEITSLTSTSEVFIPPRGRGYMKFSFDFPEPVVQFGEHRFGFLVFTAENAYALDRDKLRVENGANVMTLKCDGFVWAGRDSQQS